MPTIIFSPKLTDKLKICIEEENPEDAYAVAIQRFDTDEEKRLVVGHIPIEISRHVFFFLKLGGSVKSEVKDTKLFKSPVALKRLEIMMHVTFAIDNSKQKIIERLQDHIKLHYTVEKPTMIELEASNEDPDEEIEAEEDIIDI